MAEVPEPTACVTRYDVSCLPAGHSSYHHLLVWVEWRGRDWWAVVRPGTPTECLDGRGERDFEMRPSERTDEWLADHRFDLETALRLAKDVAPKLTVNGLTAEDLLARAAKG